MKKEFIMPVIAVKSFGCESVVTESGGDTPTPQLTNTELMENALADRGIKYTSISITEY